MGDYLLNRDGTCDYGEIIDPADIEAFGVFGKANLIRKQRRKQKRTFKQLLDKMKGRKARIGFQKMQADFGESGWRKQNSDGRKSRLARVDGLNSKGDLEQRRRGWCQAVNKPSFIERGNTDRFEAQCPIWLEKKK